MVLTLVFRSMIDFELILYVVRLETHFAFSMAIFRTIEKITLSSLNCYGTLAKNQLTINKGTNTHFDKAIFIIKKVKFYLKCGSLMT